MKRLHRGAWERGLRRIARPSGGFAMVAVDQRESLRTMLAETLPEPIPVERRVGFKLAVAEILSPHASGMLVDRIEGLEPILAAGVLDPACGLILAADNLVQAPGGPVDDTKLDRDVDLRDAKRRGAAAAKLLVIWRPEGGAEARRQLVGEFLDVAHAAGLPGIVEGVVRPPAGVAQAAWGEREEALLEATAEFATYGPDLYKAQVPLEGRADADRISATCRRMTALLACPWVVLSSGVAIEDFPAAVEAACRGGASGFLAGRAVWRDALIDAPRPALRERSVPRLQNLARVVDEHARPWSAAAAPA